MYGIESHTDLLDTSESGHGEAVHVRDTPMSVTPSSAQKKKRKIGEVDEIDSITPDITEITTEISIETAANVAIRPPTMVPRQAAPNIS